MSQHRQLTRNELQSRITRQSYQAEKDTARITAAVSVIEDLKRQLEESKKLARQVGEFLYSPDGAALERLTAAYDRWQEHG